MLPRVPFREWACKALQCVLIHFIQNNMESKEFELIQDIKAAKAAQIKQKEDSRTASFSGKKNGVSVLKVRGINGSVSFTVIKKNSNICHNFQLHSARGT